MTTNKPGSIHQRPLYGCTSCYEEVSWPAEDLRVHEGECWCDICWDERVWDFEDQPQWGELDTFTPRPAVPEGYAGATVWIGDKRVTQVVTDETLKYEREKGMAITDATQACLDLLAAAQQPEGVKQPLTAQNR